MAGPGVTADLVAIKVSEVICICVCSTGNLLVFIRTDELTTRSADHQFCVNESLGIDSSYTDWTVACNYCSELQLTVIVRQFERSVDA